MKANDWKDPEDEGETVNLPEIGNGRAWRAGSTDLVQLPGTPGGVLHKKPHGGVRFGCRVALRYESSLAQLAWPGKSAHTPHFAQEGIRDRNPSLQKQNGSHLAETHPIGAKASPISLAPAIMKVSPHSHRFLTGCRDSLQRRKSEGPRPLALRSGDSDGALHDARCGPSNQP